ncbi:MAG: hypothetical protein AAF709_22850 [Pseudomonadota bacterium]
MTITARLQQSDHAMKPFEVDADRTAHVEASMDALFDAHGSEPDFTPTTPFTVRDYVEVMEAAGVKFGFRHGVFYQDHNDVNDESARTILARQAAAGITNEDLKQFFIAASRPGPSPAGGKKPLFDTAAFADRLKSLEAKDLEILFDALVLANQAMLGVHGQPRTGNAAMDAISEVMDELGAAYSAIVTEVESREVTEGNGECFFRIVAGYQILCYEEPIQVAVTAVKYAEAHQL